MEGEKHGLYFDMIFLMSYQFRMFEHWEKLLCCISKSSLKANLIKHDIKTNLCLIVKTSPLKTC